jgi:hypothetical protein
MALGIAVCCGVMLIAMGFTSGLGWGWVAFGAVMLYLVIVGVLTL